MSWISKSKSEDSNKDYKDVAKEAFASPTSLVARYGNRSQTASASASVAPSNSVASRRSPSMILSTEDAEVFERMTTSTNVIIGKNNNNTSTSLTNPHITSTSVHSMADKVIKNAINKADTVLASSNTSAKSSGHHSRASSGIRATRSGHISATSAGHYGSVSTMSDSATPAAETYTSFTKAGTANSKGNSLTVSGTYTYTHSSQESSAIVAPSQIMVPKTQLQTDPKVNSGTTSTSSQAAATAGTPLPQPTSNSAHNSKAYVSTKTPQRQLTPNSGRKSAVSVSLDSTGLKSSLVSSMPSTPSKRGKDLDLKNNDNSFSVIGGLIVDFFQSKLRPGEAQVNLTKDDLKKLERLAPPRVRANFIEAVKHRVKTLPPNPTEVVHKLTKKCQKFGFDRDAPLNPLLSKNSSIPIPPSSKSATMPSNTSTSATKSQTGSLPGKTVKSAPAEAKAPSKLLNARATPVSQHDSVHDGKSLQQFSPGSQGISPPKQNISPNDPPESSLITLIGGKGAFSGYQNPEARDPSECGGSTKYQQDHESIISDTDTSTIKTRDIGYNTSFAGKQVNVGKSESALKSSGKSVFSGHSLTSIPSVKAPTSVKSLPIYKFTSTIEPSPKPSFKSPSAEIELPTKDKADCAFSTSESTVITLATTKVTEANGSVASEADLNAATASVASVASDREKSIQQQMTPRDMLRQAIGESGPNNALDAPDPPLHSVRPDPSVLDDQSNQSGTDVSVDKRVIEAPDVDPPEVDSIFQRNMHNGSTFDQQSVTGKLCLDPTGDQQTVATISNTPSVTVSNKILEAPAGITTEPSEAEQTVSSQQSTVTAQSRALSRPQHSIASAQNSIASTPQQPAITAQSGAQQSAHTAKSWAGQSARITQPVQQTAQQTATTIQPAALESDSARTSNQSANTLNKIENFISIDAESATIGEVSKATDSLLNELTANDSSTEEDFGSTESLARQQLMAELREATNLMAESKTTEASHFWREHVVELQSRLRALHGGGADAGSISSMSGTGKVTSNQINHFAGASVTSDILSTIVSDHQLVRSACSENLLSTLASDLAGMSREPGNFHDDSQNILQNNQRISNYQPPLVVESHRLPSPSAAPMTAPTPAPLTDTETGVTTGTTPVTSATSSSPQDQPSLDQTESNIDPSLEGVPMVDVVAPADLPGGYHFEAEIEGRRFLATVPAGGVRKGETFSCHMRDLEKVGADIPVGRWRDGIFNCCAHGPTPVLFNSLFCPLVMLSQIFTRVNFDFLGRRNSNRGARASTVRLVLWFWLLINALLCASYYLKWWNNYDISFADFGALAFVNIAYIIFIVYITASARGNLREKYFIRETFCYDLEDCCCATFCMPCTLCQMARHTADYDDYEAVCCNSTGLPDSYQPEAVAPTPRSGNNKYYV